MSIKRIKGQWYRKTSSGWIKAASLWVAIHG